MSIFSIFSIFTKSTNRFRFEQTNETTLLVTTRHWIVLVGPVIVFIFFLIFPFIVYAFLASESWFSVCSDLFWFIITVYFLVIWIFFFFTITMYFLTTLVVTNKRVVENQQNGLFYYVLKEMEKEKIQDVTVKISGILGSILDYGDIEIQSAGAINKFFFRAIPHPHKVKEIIMNKN